MPEAKASVLGKEMEPSAVSCGEGAGHEGKGRCGGAGAGRRGGGAGPGSLQPHLDVVQLGPVGCHDEVRASFFQGVTHDHGLGCLPRGLLAVGTDARTGKLSSSREWRATGAPSWDSPPCTVDHGHHRLAPGSSLYQRELCCLSQAGTQCPLYHPAQQWSSPPPHGHAVMR